MSKPKAITDDTFAAEVKESDKPVLVDILGRVVRTL